jgi:type VI secretion system protein VasJ
MTAAIRSRVAQLIAPLPATPCGSDARFDPGYEALREEVKKLESPGAARVDWAAVEKRGSALLSATTKDLLVAAYTAHALFECEGPSGLGAGLLLLNEMLDGFWDGLFPPMARMRARSSALAWWVERTSIRLGSHDGVFDAELLALLASECERLSTLVRGRFGDAAPAIGPLQQAIERIRLNAGGAPAPAAAAAGPNPPSSSPASPSPSPSPTPATAVPPDPPAAAPSAVTPSADSPSADGDDLAAQLAARAAEWLAPIRPDQPAGDDARYDDGYVRVRDQIKRLDSPAGIAVDWAAVLRDGSGLLQTRSKDLLIAAHVAYALYDQRGLDGLYSGLCLLHGLLERYWDGLYPDLRRGPRARANGIAWLIARLDTLGERALAPAELPMVAQLAQVAAELERAVETRFAEQRPALSPLSAALERLALAVPAPAPPPKTAAAPTPAAPLATPAATPAPSSAPTAAGPAAAPAAAPTVAAKLPTEIGPVPVVSNQYELDAFYRKLRGQLWDLANALRGVDDADPLAYRLARTAAYLTVVDTVPTEPNGNTTFGAPSPYLLGEVEGLVKDQHWQKALALAESSLQKSAYLLDLHRHVHASLQRLGPRYARAQRTVEAELSSLLERAPELAERKFDNGTPFADAATKEWLAELAASGGGAGATKAGDEADAEDQAALAAVRSAIAAGQTADALEAFEDLLGRLGSGRERFGARLVVARAHAAAGSGEMAAAMFEGLIEELDRHRIDVWDPSLASECLASYYHCLKALGQRDKEMAQAAGVVYRRLCRVDPKRALTEASR